MRPDRGGCEGMSGEHDQKPVLRDIMGKRIVTRRQVLGIGAGAFVAAILAACGGEAATSTTAPAASKAPAASSAASASTAPAASAAGSSAAAKKGGEFHGAWPYDVPPKGHYNSAIGVVDGIFAGG